MSQASTLPNNFTLLRLGLATLVVFGHFKTLHAGTVVPFGISYYADVAVDAFFVVSGYLIAGSYNRRPNLIDFYVKRIFRIYPLYALMIVLQAGIMIGLLGGFAGHMSGLARYLGANLAFANFLAHDIDGLFAHAYNHGINPSLWTIKIEVAFYLILPGLWMLTRRYGFAVLAMLYVASTVFAEIAIAFHHADFAKEFPGQLRFFVVGMAFYRYGDRIRIAWPIAALLVPLLFALCSLLYLLPLLTIYPLLVGSLVFLCAARLPPIPLGRDISYGVYLIHAPLIQLSLLLGFFRDSLPCLALVMGTAYALAFVAEAAIERPGIAFGRKLLGLRPKVTPDLPEPFSDRHR